MTQQLKTRKTFMSVVDTTDISDSVINFCGFLKNKSKTSNNLLVWTHHEYDGISATGH